MQQQLPQNLNYNDIKPIGYPSHIRVEKYTPIAFNTSTTGVSSSDIIRFNISSNGFWDPYSAYIKLEVDVSQMDGQKNGNQSSGSLQLDNSACSFISQLIISKGGTEIERIEEYDTISAILNDMNSVGENRVSRYFEGLWSQPTLGGQQYANPIQMGTSSMHLNYLPLQLDNQSVVVSNNSFGVQTQAQTASTTPVNRYEFVLNSEDAKETVQNSSTNTLAKNNITTNTCGLSMLVQNSVSTVTVGNYLGMKLPFCNALSSFGNEPLLSKNIYKNTQYKGALNQYIFADRQTFCIPIVSGLLGILMPKESYKYVPMKALQELILEFRLSPYAMFTSGYADGASNLTNATGNSLLPLGTTTNPMLNRIWRITKFEINVEMQYFESNVENVILGQLNTEKGIIIHTNSWMLGPRYQINANTSPNGTYQVNLGFESLKNVLWVYLPDEFTTYTYCRKQYRLSANITQLYIKIGSEYYPPLPITGHAGNPGGYQSINNDVDYSNSEFLIQLYKSFGKFHDIQQNCTVNSINFAVNQRAYDPTNLTALYSGVGVGYQNLDTTLSNPLFHENRCVGRAVYALNLETLNQDFNVISGINTINNRPFEITLKSDNTNSYPRSYTKYVFCNYDMLIQLRKSGIQILGRG